MTRSAERRQRGFTLVELVVAGTVAAMLLTAITFSLSQLGRARNIARDRAEAFQRAATALEAVRRDVVATIRSDDLFETRFLLETKEPGVRTGGRRRSELLLFSTAMRPIREIEYQGEGREYEVHFRVEDDELGSALWNRRDNVPDAVPDGGGVALPVADGVVGIVVEASDGEAGWRDEWDSDVDGIPRVVRIEVTATGAEIGTEPQELTPEVTLRTVVAIDRVVAPREEPEPVQDPGTPPTDASGGAPAGGGGVPTGGAGPAPTGDDSLGGGRGGGMGRDAGGGGMGRGGGGGGSGRGGAPRGGGGAPRGGPRGGGGGR
jgi:prepilin-type N-terminal cleavage/methylation domain-containing protein